MTNALLITLGIIALLLAGGGVLRYAWPRQRRMGDCPECGHRLPSPASPRCPACGENV